MKVLFSRSMARNGVAFLSIGLLLVIFAACDGEDRPGSVVVDPDSETASVSGTGTGSVTGADFGPGVVEPKPAGAEQVNVSLAEWAVSPDRAKVPAGKVYFYATNVGPNDPHELVIIRTDLAPDELPAVDGKVPEDEVDMIGEIEPFIPGTEAATTFDLAPGNYALICNITEIEDGALESHYELGMWTRLVVE